MKQQHQVVSKKVLQLILEHQNSCTEEFQHVLQVLDKVKDTLDLCKRSRSELSIVKREYQESLVVMANYRKRKLAQNLLNKLKMIKNLVSKNFELYIRNYHNFFSITLTRDCKYYLMKVIMLEQS